MSTRTRIPAAWSLVATLLVAGGCDTLNVSNPNAPDSPRLLSDPATVQSIAVGALRTWYNTTQAMDPDGSLIVMARSHVASWNNWQIRIYTGCTTGPAPTYGTCGTTIGTYPRIEWQNDPTAAARVQIEGYWYGYYSALSSANDVLKAIRVTKLVITDSVTTKMVETMAVLAQALTLSGIALNYDKGFIVDYNTDLTTLQFSTRAQLRDAALAKFDEAITLANANKFTVPDNFFNSPGTAYDNKMIAQIANTMAARTLAYFARDAAENAAVDWARVVGYASKGISSGTAFDWVFKHDGCVNYCDYLKNWSNDMTTMRVHTRVTHLLDPVSQEDPWPINNPLSRPTAGITGSPLAQAVTPLSMQYITTGRQISVDTELVVVTGTTATTFTAVVTQDHPGPTTLSAAITKDTVPQAATPASMTGIHVGALVWVEDTATTQPREVVTVKSVTATTFTALFKKNHPAGATVSLTIHRNKGAQGNPQPSSPDKRLGDGTYGTGKFAANVTETPDADAGAGTDYAWSFDEAIQPSARGSWHQTSIGQVRYITLSGIDPNGTSAGFGPGPVVLGAENDLLWAEGLIRSGGSAVTAAGLINKSRVGRGGLPALTGAETAAQLLAALQYEQDVELPGSNVAPYYNQRRIDGLEALTPHEMPVPAKELGVLQQPLYTWGGGNPPNSPSAPAGSIAALRAAPLIWPIIEQQMLMQARANPRRARQ